MAKLIPVQGILFFKKKTQADFKIWKKTSDFVVLSSIQFKFEFW
jgi:hypothetical protein